jgi:hypothetical protein
MSRREPPVTIKRLEENTETPGGYVPPIKGPILAVMGGISNTCNLFVPGLMKIADCTGISAGKENHGRLDVPFPAARGKPIVSPGRG